MKVIEVSNEQQLADAYQVRSLVFIEEQCVAAELEHDQHDETAIHLVGYLYDQPIAAGRIRLLDQFGKMERVAIIKQYRGQKYGQQLMTTMERVLAEHGRTRAKLNAQVHALLFYQTLGYQITSDVFLEAGIEHVAMEKNVTN
jgi:predicted GNAT family N-acyltransferase